MLENQDWEWILETLGDAFSRLGSRGAERSQLRKSVLWIAVANLMLPDFKLIQIYYKNQNSTRRKNQQGKNELEKKNKIFKSWQVEWKKTLPSRVEEL